MQRVTFDNFTEGLRTDVDALLLPRGAASAAENVTFSRGTLDVRPGRVAHSALPAWTTSGVRALCEYAHASDTKTARLLACVNDTIYVTDNATQTFDGTEITLATTVSTSGTVRMVQYQDVVYIADGVNAVKKWLPADGTAVTVLEDVDVPQVEPGVTVTSLPGELSRRSADLAGWQGRDNNGVTGVPTTWVTLTDWNANAISSADLAEFEGMTTRKITDTTYTATDRAEAVALEFVSDRGIADMTPNPVQGVGLAVQQLVAPVDISRATRLSITFNVLATAIAGAFSIEVHLGETFTVGDTALTTVFTNDADGNPLGDSVTPGTWYTKDIDLTATPDTELDAVQWLGIKVNTGTSTDIARVQFANTTFYDNRPYAVSLLLDNITADISLPELIADTYEITYTYAWDVGDPTEYEGAPYRSSDDLHPYKEVVVTGDNTVGFTIACTLDATVDAEAIYIYARGGTLATFRRVATIGSLSADPAAQVFNAAWYGAVEPTAGFLEEYVQSPPTGTSLLATYKGRMLYAKDDTLWFAQVGNADRVSPTSLVVASGSEGAYATAGVEGREIVALGVLGSYLVALKRKGAYFLEGEDANSFQLIPMTASVGCVRHETVQQVEDLLIVADAQQIWGWNGQGLVEVGKPIAATWQAFTDAQRAAAFAVYDPLTRRYLLTVPNTSTGAAPSSTTLVYDLVAGSWTQWTAQPGGCAISTTKTATVGVYAGDPYGTGAAGKVYRLMTGTTDATSSGSNPIAWLWQSRAITASDPLMYLDVMRVLARCTAADESLSSVTLSLRANGNPSNNLSSGALTVPDAPGVPSQTTWAPAPLADAASVQLRVSGSSTGALSISLLDLLMLERGGYR